MKFDRQVESIRKFNTFIEGITCEPLIVNPHRTSLLTKFQYIYGGLNEKFHVKELRFKKAFDREKIRP